MPILKMKPTLNGEGGGSTGGIEYVELNDNGTLTQEQLTKLQNGAFVKYANAILMPTGTNTYGSAVYYTSKTGYAYKECSINQDNTYSCSIKPLSQA